MIQGLEKMQIRIQGFQKCESKSDPDPKPCLEHVEEGDGEGGQVHRHMNVRAVKLVHLVSPQPHQLRLHHLTNEVPGGTAHESQCCGSLCSIKESGISTWTIYGSGSRSANNKRFQLDPDQDECFSKLEKKMCLICLKNFPWFFTKYFFW